MFAFIKGLSPLQLSKDKELRLSSIAASDCHLITNHAPNICNDSYLYQDQNTLACFDGILANSQSLIDSYGSKGIKGLLERVLLVQDTSMPRHFFGQFTCMSFHAKEKERGIFFGNQMGSARLYYWHQENRLVVSNSLAMVVAILRHNQVQCHVNELGLRMLLVYGYTLADFSTIAQIKHLEAGKILEWESGTLKVSEYHNYHTEASSAKVHQALPILNDLFKEALGHIRSWDLQHHKKHLAFLSGGLDSRMAVYTAVNLGFKGLSVLNFSQSGYRDNRIAMKIAQNLKLNYHLYPLDQGKYLVDAHEAIFYNEGQVVYHGAAHLEAALKSMNLDDYGVIVSGQVGDLVLGSFLSMPRHEKAGTGKKGISLNPQDDPELEDAIRQITPKYPNHEIYALYNRGINASSNGDLACYKQGHSLSPFMYPPFADFCLSLDPKIRYNNHLYFKWISTYQSQAAKVPWEKTGIAPSFGTKAFTLAIFARRIREKMALMGLLKQKNMNPFERWLKEDASLAKSLNTLMMNSDTHAVISKSSASALFQKNLTSPYLSIQMSAYTAAHSLNLMLGAEDIWIPKRFIGGFS